MQGRSNVRLFVLGVLIMSLIVTLGFRAYYVQVLDPDKPVNTALRAHVRDVVVPAARGAIVDDMGRPLAESRTSLVVTVNRSELERLDDKGKAVLERLSPIVGISAEDIRKQITPCQRGVPKPCWIGSPFQPVPIRMDTTPDVILNITEHREDFPGVRADVTAVRSYPGGQLGAHALGYTGPPSQEELDNAAAEGNTDLHDVDVVGRSGLERQYDDDLRGDDGTQRVNVDNRGSVVSLGSEDPAVPGDTLVTSLDLGVQTVVDKALSDQIQRSRNAGFPAPTAAAVVLNPHNGHVIGIGSYPSFDPNAFVGGISQEELDVLISKEAGTPLISRATQGQFAPGSTFKLVSTSAAFNTGQATFDGRYSCPGSLQVGNRVKTNFESKGIEGNPDMRVMLAKSCDTIYYQFAMEHWYRDQARVDSGQQAEEIMQKMARAFGFGSRPNIDLPEGEQTRGQITDRAFKQQRWEENRDQYCADASSGYPNEPDPARRAFLVQLAAENCTDGWRYRIGDHADLFIGQGETTVSPLQLAIAYAALVNGGRILDPRMGRAIIGQDGTVKREIQAKERGRIPVGQDVLTYIRDALRFNNGLGVSGEGGFSGFPYDQVPVGGKTGTAEVFGRQDTGWIATWGPYPRFDYVIVGMVEEAGLGSQSAGTLVRQIWDGIYGLNGQQAAFPGGIAPENIPKIESPVAVDQGSPGGRAQNFVPSAQNEDQLVVVPAGPHILTAELPDAGSAAPIIFPSPTYAPFASDQQPRGPP